MEWRRLSACEKTETPADQQSPLLARLWLPPRAGSQRHNLPLLFPPCLTTNKTAHRGKRLARRAETSSRNDFNPPATDPPHPFCPFLSFWSLYSLEAMFRFGARGGTRTPTALSHQILNLARLPVPPLSHNPHSRPTEFQTLLDVILPPASCQQRMFSAQILAGLGSRNKNQNTQAALLEPI